MEMFRRIFFAAVLAGVAAGLVAAVVQQWRVVPLILEAELYEIDDADALLHAEDATPAAPHTHEAQGAQPWSPADGVERTFYTVLSTVLTGLGFALLVAAVSALAGIEVTPANALAWGLGGFVTFSLMPGIGLPPELPGMIAADLGTRQVWWVGTVLATLAAILALVKIRGWTGAALGIVLVLAPHIIGAPQPAEGVSAVPAHLASIYVINALFSSLAFWLVLGATFAWTNQKLLQKEAA